MNTDGFLNPSKAANAGQVWDSKGMVIGASHVFSYQQPIHMLELRGALLGLHLCLFHATISKENVAGNGLRVMHLLDF